MGHHSSPALSPPAAISLSMAVRSPLQIPQAISLTLAQQRSISAAAQQQSLSGQRLEQQQSITILQLLVQEPSQETSLPMATLLQMLNQPSHHQEQIVS